MAISINDTYEGDLLDYDGQKKQKWLIQRSLYLQSFPACTKFFEPKMKKLILISFCILFLKVNAPNIIGTVIDLAMIKNLV